MSATYQHHQSLDILSSDYPTSDTVARWLSLQEGSRAILGNPILSNPIQEICLFNIVLFHVISSHIIMVIITVLSLVFTFLIV